VPVWSGRMGVNCGGARGGNVPSSGFEGKGGDDIVVCPPSILGKMGI
jgi:hypothetical protein